MLFKLAEITIIQGEYHRLNADTTKVKKLPTAAPRGLITDTYGRVLAENITSFSVQIMKDELIENDRNLTSLKILSLLEKQGETYNDEFPIILNSIDYKSDEDFLNSAVSLKDEITNLIIENNLLDNLLDKTYEHRTSYNDYKFSVASRALSILSDSKEIIEVPIKVEYTKDGISYQYKEGKKIDEWKNSQGLPKGDNPKGDVLRLLLKDTNRINTLINHPIVAKYAYELLNEKGLVNNFKLVDYQFLFDIEYKEVKKNLITEIEMDLMTLLDDGLTDEAKLDIFGETKKGLSEKDKLNLSKQIPKDYPLLYPKIDLKTSAKEDFITLLSYKGFKSFMSTTIDEENTVALGEELLKYIQNSGVVIPIVYSPEEGKVFKYTDTEKKDEFLSKYNLQTDISADGALDNFVKTHIIDNNKVKSAEGKSVTNTIFGKFITSDDIKFYSQSFLLNYINPKISTSKWEYTSIINKKTWIKGKKIDEYNDAKEVFDKLVIKYDVDLSESLSIYEKRFILLIADMLGKQGYRAYEPINIAYNVKDETIAMIKEQSRDLPGIKTAIEPMRYYPMGESAAHALGYLGKISQGPEIEKYINKLDYSRNDIIGKTGIEKEFEQFLKGEDGYRTVEVDAFGNTHRTIEGEAPIPGNNIQLTIDSDLQKIAEDSLKEAIEKIQVGGTYESEWGNHKYGKPYRNATSGSTVAIDVKTGEVLAIANYPSYDPNLFATGISANDYEKLKPENEKDYLAARPLNNLAIRGKMPPGSTFKMLTALAGLENGLNPYTKVNSLGYVKIGNTTQACWIWNDYRGTHGPTNMYEALRDSCNYYFYTLAAGRNLRTGQGLGLNVSIEDMQNMSKEFGFDEKTGIEIPEEISGSIPNEEDKLAVANRALRSFLLNRKDELIEGKNLNDKEIDELVNIFSEWASREDKMSVKEVIEGLKDLDIEEETQVYVLKDYLYYTYFRSAEFGLGDALSISIGQGENNYTTIQIANYVATLVNGGYKHEVSIIDDITSYDGKDVGYEKDKKVERIDIKDYKYLDDIKKGMLQVVEDGSVRGIFKDLPVKVGGKTGTAQAWGSYDNFAWFVGFAPYDNPEIAVATVIVQGGSGGNSAPVTRDIIAKYLGVNKEIKEMNIENKLMR
nr:penicillin-binding transpeptidase domain-containing protein [Anaeromonas frigoriresistens]